MSLVPPGSASLPDIRLYTSVQVAVTCAALYDHTLSVRREVELIWMKPVSLITALYVIERYLGDIVLIAGLCLCFPVAETPEECVNASKIVTSDLPYTSFFLSAVGKRLFQFRAWGALLYSWAMQATMQLRVYALYNRSRRTLILLVTVFLCQIAAIAFIIWRTIGPDSSFEVMTHDVPGAHFCAFSYINPDFIYLFIPFVCFESFLFLLAARVFLESIKYNRETKHDKVLGENSFLRVMARDSLCYFFVNLVACSVVMGLWQSVTELYANICILFIMFLEVLVGTRLILDFRERYARPEEPVVSGRCSSLYFRGDDIQMTCTRISVRCDIETVIMADDFNVLNDRVY